MPFKTDTSALKDPFFKRSAKLLPCQKEMMLHWFNQGLTIRGITKMFHCSRRTVQFILFPERHRKNLADRKDRGGSMIYYKKEDQTKATREHRRYKYNLLKGTI